MEINISKNEKQRLYIYGSVIFVTMPLFSCGGEANQKCGNAGAIIKSQGNDYAAFTLRKENGAWKISDISYTDD